MTLSPVPLKRVPAWGPNLTRFIRECRQLSQKGELKFDWENVNCAWFAGGAIREMTGVDFYGPFNSVTSAFAAAKLLHTQGYHSLEAYTDSLAPERPLSEAQRGDAVLIQGLTTEEGLALGIADPPFYWAVSEEGLIKGELWTATGNVRPVKAYAIG